jgi:RHS repeat-associated protein
MTAETNTSTGAVTTFAYDYRNRLMGDTTKNSGGTITNQETFTYDALNRRTGFDINGTQTWTVYDGQNAYADFNGTGTLEERYLYGPALNQILARTSSGGTTAWYLTDRLRSVRDLATTSGSIIDHISYDSFGNVLSESGPGNGDRFKFATMENDGVTGAYYDRARFYSPTIGRFIAQDALRFSAGDWNLYRYVGNSPTNNVDPTGLMALKTPAQCYAEYNAMMAKLAARLAAGEIPAWQFTIWSGKLLVWLQWCLAQANIKPLPGPGNGPGPGNMAGSVIMVPFLIDQMATTLGDDYIDHAQNAVRQRALGSDDWAGAGESTSWGAGGK